MNVKGIETLHFSALEAIGWEGFYYLSPCQSERRRPIGGVGEFFFLKKKTKQFLISTQPSNVL